VVGAVLYGFYGGLRMLGPKKCFLLSEKRELNEPRFLGLQVLCRDDKTAQAASKLNYAIGILQKAHREDARSLLAVQPVFYWHWKN
jgi:hypothetical protein